MKKNKKLGRPPNKIRTRQVRLMWKWYVADWIEENREWVNQKVEKVRKSEK